MSRSLCAFFPRITVVVALLLQSVSIQAQQAGSAGLLPEGQTLIQLSVTERRDVTPDRLVATLRVEKEDRNPQALQRQINSMMEQALDHIGEPGDITVSTGRYTVHQYQRQPQGGRSDMIWRGSQSLSLRTEAAHQRVHELAGALQGMGFVMNQLSWELSNRQADETREALLEAAIGRAQAQAGRAGQALGKDDVELAEVTVQNAGGFSPEMMRSTAMDATGSSVPSSRPGETEVTLTINVRAVAR
ncbi:MAG: SIMPL domain-containing protein [Pseudohongiellaceae bacterium]